MSELNDHLKEMPNNYWLLASHLVTEHNQEVKTVYNRQLGRLDDLHRRLHDA